MTPIIRLCDQSISEAYMSVQKWRDALDSYKRTNKLLTQFEYNNLTDAVAEMTLWLKEHKRLVRITVEEVG